MRYPGSSHPDQEAAADRRAEPVTRVTALVSALAVAVLTACPSAAQPQPQPQGAHDGIQFAGRLGTQQLNVSAGSPEVRRDDCDPNDGPDEDLCLVTHTVEGQPIALVVENPAALDVGTPLPVRTPDAVGCTGGCDDVREAAIVELRRGPERAFAIGGTVTVRGADERMAAGFLLRFRGGSITGRFDVAPG